MLMEIKLRNILLKYDRSLLCIEVFLICHGNYETVNNYHIDTLFVFVFCVMTLSILRLYSIR